MKDQVLTSQKKEKTKQDYGEVSRQTTMQQRCGSCSCVNVGGDQAVALSLGFGHSLDDNNKTITIKTRSRGLKVPRFQVSMVS